MADDAVKSDAKPGSAAKAGAHASEEPHYEEVSEYRIGEGPPPLFLVLAFFFIVAWACFSWVPFFGY